MADLPSGIVTFVMTDIVNSTVLFGTLGSQWPPLLEAHRAIVRGQLAAAGGVEVETEGDSFLMAFDDAARALEFAADLQRSMRQLEAQRVRVRAGLHTHPAEPRGTAYTSIGVHLTARVMHAAHGGQVLVSEETVAEAQGSLRTVQLRDLGEFRLKGFPGGHRLHQVVGAGLDADFPAPRVPRRDIGNLPLAQTAFVGREIDLQQVRQRIASSRLVTLVGAGGSGKTRLALAAAAEVAQSEGDSDAAGEAWFAELAPVRDGSLVASAVARSLGLEERTGRDVREMLLEELADRSLLLVIDNCEHLVRATADFISALLLRCPHVRILATSRQPLHVPGEVVIPVPPLRVPPADANDLIDYEAVRLFIHRAEAAGAQLDASPEVAEICRRLDGVPLAIELVAARCRQVPVHELARRVSHRLAISSLPADATAGVDARHHSLRTAIEWSHDLLSADERVLLRRLGVFAAPFDLEGAEAICSAPPLTTDAVMDVLGLLVDRSLVERAGERYRLLETVAEFAMERLAEAGETSATLAEFRTWAASAAQAGMDDWFENGVRRGVGNDYENLHAALVSALTTDPSLTVRIANPLGFLCMQSRRSSDAAGFLAAALEEPGDADPALVALTTSRLAVCRVHTGSIAAAEETARRAVRLADRSGDRLARAQSRYVLSDILRTRGAVGEARGPALESLRLFEELAAEPRPSGFVRVMAVHARLRAAEMDLHTDEPAGEDAHGELMDIAARTPQGPQHAHGVASARLLLAQLYERSGDLEAAELYAERAASLQTSTVRAHTLGLVAVLKLRRGDIAGCVEAARESDRLLAEVEDPVGRITGAARLLEAYGDVWRAGETDLPGISVSEVVRLHAGLDRQLRAMGLGERVGETQKAWAPVLAAAAVPVRREAERWAAETTADQLIRELLVAISAVKSMP